MFNGNFSILINSYVALINITIPAIIKNDDIKIIYLLSIIFTNLSLNNSKQNINVVDNTWIDKSCVSEAKENNLYFLLLIILWSFFSL